MANVPQKPLWPPSGKLWPQSRQFPDQYGEDLVGTALDAVAPIGWGLARLVLEEAALAQGVVRIVQAEGRFPSGAPLSVVPGAALARALPAEREAAQVVVYIGLARASADAPNVSDDPRETAAVRYGRAKAGAESVLQPSARILFDDEGAETYERIPVASVSVAGRVGVEPWFLPPMLRLLADSPVSTGLREVVAALAARRDGLLAEREGRPLDLRAFAAASAPYVLLLSAIGRALAVLDAPDLSSWLAPKELHDVLAGLLGTLEGLDGRRGTPIPPYAHEAPGPSFRSLIERLLALIPDVARSAHRILRMQRLDGWNYSLAIDDPDLLRRRVYLVASGVDEAWVATHLPAHAKIASRQALPTVLNTATRGVPLALEFDPQPFLPSSAVHCSFRVDVRSQYWADVLHARSLVVHVPQAPAELELAVYVLPVDAR